MPAGPPQPSASDDPGAVEALWDAGRRAYPEFGLSLDDFRALLAARHEPAPGVPDPAELYLACACAAGTREALTVFEQQCVRAAQRKLTGMRLAPELIADFLQQVRAKLLVAEEDEPARIVRYAGTGRLPQLVCVMAVHAAVSHLRTTQSQSLDEELLDLPTAADDPVLSVLRQRGQEVFRSCFHEALASLSPRERNLLRLRFIDGVAVADIAAQYQVNRVTVSRWLADVRRQLASTTMALLRLRHDIPADELQSLLTLVDSQIDLSLERVLGK